MNIRENIALAMVDIKYNSAIKISKPFDEYEQRPLFVIFKAKNDDGLTSILKMTVAHLEKSHDTIHALIRMGHGTEDLESYIEKENKKIAVVNVLRWCIRRDGGIYISTQRQLIKLFEYGYSVVSATFGVRRINQSIRELEKIGFKVVVIEQSDRINSFDYPGMVFDDEPTPAKEAIELETQGQTVYLTEIEDYKTRCIPINEREPVLLGEVKAFERPNKSDYGNVSTGWRETKFVICPHCLKATTLGRDSDDEEFRYDPTCIVGTFEGLVVQSEKGFKRHVRQCEPLFDDDGIWEVISDKQKLVAERFALISRRETLWNSSQIDRSSFRRGARAFILIDEGVPKAYNAFWKQDTEDFGEIYTCWDTYTFPEFRGKGYASLLLHHGINILEIDINHFPISFPVTEAAKNFTSKIAGENIIAFMYGRYSVIKKNDLIKEWKGRKPSQ